MFRPPPAIVASLHQSLKNNEKVSLLGQREASHAQWILPVSAALALSLIFRDAPGFHLEFMLAALAAIGVYCFRAETVKQHWFAVTNERLIQIDRNNEISVIARRCDIAKLDFSGNHLTILLKEGYTFPSTRKELEEGKEIRSAKILAVKGLPTLIGGIPLEPQGVIQRT